MMSSSVVKNPSSLPSNSKKKQTLMKKSKRDASNSNSGGDSLPSKDIVTPEDVIKFDKIADGK